MDLATSLAHEARQLAETLGQQRLDLLTHAAGEHGRGAGRAHRDENRRALQGFARELMYSSIAV